MLYRSPVFLAAPKNTSKLVNGICKKNYVSKNGSTSCKKNYCKTTYCASGYSN